MKFTKRFFQYAGVAVVVIIWILFVQKAAPLGTTNLGNLNASAWLDENSNGVKDAGELPLADVCIWYSVNPSDDTSPVSCARTDQNGNWTENFSAGAPQAGAKIYYFAAAPDGYKLTTSNVAEGQNPSFGFAPLPAVSSPQSNPLGPKSIDAILPWVFGILVVAALAYGAWQTRDDD